MKLKKYCNLSDLVLIHDAIRPNVSQEIIFGCIAECQLHGSAIIVIPCAEAMLLRGETPDSSVALISIKIITTEYIEIFKALSMAQKDDWMK